MWWPLEMLSRLHHPLSSTNFEGQGNWHMLISNHHFADRSVSCFVTGDSIQNTIHHSFWKSLILGTENVCMPSGRNFLLKPSDRKSRWVFCACFAEMTHANSICDNNACLDFWYVIEKWREALHRYKFANWCSSIQYPWLEILMDDLSKWEKIRISKHFWHLYCQ